MSIDCREFEKLRDTPKGKWIVPKGYRLENQKKWVPNKSKKKYAYPTKEEAWKNLKARTRMWISHAESSLERARKVSNRIKVIEAKEAVQND